MSRVVLTFKNNEQEKSIEKFLESKLAPTAYIKELLWEVMNETRGTNIKSEEKIEIIKDENEEKEIKEEPKKIFEFDPTKNPF